MPTPVSQQIVRDTFVRANSGNLGANWTANSDAIDTGTMGITSNQAQAQTPFTGNAASFWNANTFTANQYAQCIVNYSVVAGGGSYLVGLIVRGSAGGYYRLVLNGNNTSSNLGF